MHLGLVLIFAKIIIVMTWFRVPFMPRFIPLCNLCYAIQSAHIVLWYYAVLWWSKFLVYHGMISRLCSFLVSVFSIQKAQSTVENLEELDKDISHLEKFRRYNQELRQKVIYFGQTYYFHVYIFWHSPIVFLGYWKAATVLCNSVYRMCICNILLFYATRLDI